MEIKTPLLTERGGVLLFEDKSHLLKCLTWSRKNGSKPLIEDKFSQRIIRLMNSLMRPSLNCPESRADPNYVIGIEMTDDGECTIQT